VAKVVDDAEALLCFFDFPWLLCQAAAAWLAWSVRPVSARSAR
jgi:hypothetical protein